MKHKRAIVRRPGDNFVLALTNANLGAPFVEKALQQHEAYCDALRKCGLELTVLTALPEFPDAPFVEDTAIITEACAIITRPGDESRRGEEQNIKDILKHYRPLKYI